MRLMQNPAVTSVAASSAPDSIAARAWCRPAIWKSAIPLLGFAVMNPPIIARGDQVVDMHVPKGRAVLRLMFKKQCLEPAEACHLGAVQAKTAGYLGDVAAAVGGVHRVDPVGAEFVGLGPVAPIIDNADQELDAVALDCLQLLDVLVKTAVAVNQHHLAVVPRRGDPNRG